MKHVPYGFIILKQQSLEVNVVLKLSNVTVSVICLLCSVLLPSSIVVMPGLPVIEQIID